MQFLPAILPNEASSREDMCILLRTRMLEAIRDGPVDVGAELTWIQRTQVLMANISVYSLSWIVYQILSRILAQHRISAYHAGLIFTLASIAITLLFYIYMMYVVPNLHLTTKSKSI